MLFRLGKVGAHSLHLFADGAHLTLKVAAALKVPHLATLAATPTAATATHRAPRPTASGAL